MVSGGKKGKKRAKKPEISPFFALFVSLRSPMQGVDSV
jgi:hypothetical protein